MKSDLIDKIAALLLVFFFLGPDLGASIQAINEFPSEPISETSTEYKVQTRLQAVRNVKKVKRDRVKENHFETVSTPVRFRSKDDKGYLGNHPKDPMHKPENDIFKIEIDTNRGKLHSAYLKYSIKGLNNGFNIPKSINESLTYAGLPIEQGGSDWQDIYFKVEKGQLKQGVNEIRFSLPLNKSFPVTIKNVEIIFSSKKIASAKMPQAIKKPARPEDFSVLQKKENVRLEALALEDFDMPSIPRNIVNVTRGKWGYSTNSKESMPVQISLGVDRKKLLSDSRMSEVQIFFFNKESLSWEKSNVRHVDMAKRNVEGTVPSNTQYFGGLIKAPNMPQASAFVSTDIASIKAAKPSEGMNIMQPPSVSKTGEASINYPLAIPPGRNGMTPSLNLSYSSDRSTGWLGMGWDLPVSKVSIDTRWGVPTFPENTQEEVYLLDGKSLSMEGELKGNRKKIEGEIEIPNTRETGVVHFFERTRGAYQEIIREGSDTTNYVWRVERADQKTYYYGTTDGTNLNTNSVLRDDNGNILSWYLKRVEDKWGNYITYNYSHTTVSNSQIAMKNGGKSVRLSSIEYTHHSNKPAKYEIELITSTTERLDATVSLKPGTKVVDDYTLKQVNVKYDNAIIKHFEFIYKEGDFFKTLLDSVKEYRNGNHFYSHAFEYYSDEISYGAKQEIEVDHFNHNLFGQMASKIASLSPGLNEAVTPSPLNTTTTAGWTAGGSIGPGLAVGPLALPDKTFTFSGRFSYGETDSKDKMRFEDANGDGLPDLIYRKRNGIKYYPMQVDSEGNYSLGGYRDVNYGRKLLKSSTTIKSRGFDFAMPMNAFYYGKNWRNTTRTISSYITDYNADGILDVVEPNGDNTKVQFGHINDKGDINFSTSSEHTFNPVFKGEPVVDDTPEDSLKDFEIVRSWIAPFEGIIDVSGQAEIMSGLTGEASVGVQHNNNLLGMTLVNPSSPANISHTFAVNKSDTVVFRVRSMEDGQEDLVKWNPEVAYQNQSKVDANGLDYAESNYQENFLLSANEGVSAYGNESVTVSWPSFTVQNMTDEVVLRVHLTAQDTITKDRVFDSTYIYEISAGQQASPLASKFSPEGSTHTPAFFNSLVQLPGAQSHYRYNISFEVWSTSNVKWDDIKWRPTVELGSEPCGETEKMISPAVFFSTYNRLVQMEGPFNPEGLEAEYLRTWPVLEEYTFEATELFTRDELNASNHPGHTAYLVTKSGGNLLSKMALQFHTDGTVTFHQVSPNGTLGSNLSISDPTDPAIGNFYLPSEIQDEELFCSFFTENPRLGDFLPTWLENLGVYQAGTSNLASVPFTAWNVFKQELNEFQDHQLHWGQFAWSEYYSGSIDAIPTVEMELATKAFAEENDYSESTPDAGDFDNMDTEALNPMNQKFFILNARRGEDSLNLRSYIRHYDSVHYPESLDRWVAWGQHFGVYSHLGVSAPGKFGEKEETPTLVPVTLGAYSAFGVQRATKSSSLADNVATFIYGESETINDASKYYSHTLRAFRDMNGDGYADILREGLGLNVQTTNSLGGHKSGRVYALSPFIDKTVVTRESKTISGTFANEDARFTKNLNIGNGTGNTFSKIQWVDINGDGLVDRLEDDGAVSVNLNTGRYLDVNSVGMSNLELIEFSSKSESLSGAFNVKGNIGNASQTLGLSFNVGVGVNATSNNGERILVDLNGDGLVDRINLTGGLITVLLNTGTTFKPYTQGSFSTIDELNKSKAIGVSGKTGGSAAITLASFWVLNLKLSGSANGQINYAVNELNSSLKDVNGDGVTDFVKQDGNIEIYPGEIGKSNLLKQVTNPLKGGYVIDYNQEGNKFGNYPTQVKIHSTKPDEKMVWDMPFKKWVMDSLKVFDGLNMASGSNDLDGTDTLRYGFNYDGGVKSRREREFLGFTRIETEKPANIAEPNASGGVKNYISSVTDYYRPTSNEPAYRKRLPYLKDVITDHYILHHGLAIVDDPVTEEQMENHEIKLMKHTQNEYEYRLVGMDNQYEFFNQVRYPEEEWELVDWESISEAACIFPALQATETFTIPQTSEADKYQAVRFELKHDTYFNITEYSNEGLMSPGSIDTAIVDTIIDNHYDYHYRNFAMSDVERGRPPFDVPITVPGSDQTCFRIPSLVSGYPVDTVCLPSYINDPCDLEDQPAGDNDSIRSVHRKLTLDTIFIEEPVYSTNYSGAIIAQMDYFEPINADNQTNVLKEHKIYLGAVNSQGLERYASATLTSNGRAYKKTRNHLDNSGSNYSETTIDYDADGLGNVIKITGPPNHQGHIMEIDYTYDADIAQYITGISNSYGESVCMDYDLATGNLRRKVDVNGHPTQFVYDDFFRLKEVWAPLELYDNSAAATINFKYFPEGVDPDDSDTKKHVPVAVTEHNINATSGDPDSPPSPSSIDCSTLIDVSGRPAIQAPLQTATFMDGRQRIVQVKKDVSKKTPNPFSGYQNFKFHQVSGLRELDRVGREIEVSKTYLEGIQNIANKPYSTNIGFFNDSKSTLPALAKSYDYANRPVFSTAIHEDGILNNGDLQNYSETQMSYGWDDKIDNTDYFYTWYEYEGGQDNKSYINSFRQKIALVSDEDGTAPATTRFEPDALDQLKKTIDPIGQETMYTYDRLGRMTEEDHPDRGITTYTYDDAGNVTNIETPETGSAGIDLTYQYTRLKEKTFPNSLAVNDVVYTYGSLSDGKNGAGRVTKVVQGQTYKIERYKYDALGNLIFEKKEIEVPQAGLREFTTTMDYDSWGRTKSIVYPDNEEVSYSYATAGELESISADKASYNNPRVIVEEALYNGFGQMASVEYGNGATTTFSYSSKTRRMTDLQLVSNSNTLLDKTVEYYKTGNIESIDNTAQAVNGMGGSYTHDYTYDALGRLVSALSDFKNGEQDISLQLTYNKAGGILSKNQSNSGSQAHSSHSYSFSYDYKSGKKHQLEQIGDPNFLYSRQYEYNDAGSVLGIYEERPEDCPPGEPCISTEKVYLEQFRWDEEQKLSGVKNDNGIHHYLYDHNGQRIMKTSLTRTGVALNGQEGTNSYTADPYTVYVNPYYVVKNFSETVEASKHYYMGRQRVASALINFPFVSNLGEFPGGGGEEPGSGTGESVSSGGAAIDLDSLLTYFGLEAGVDYNLDSLTQMESKENYSNYASLSEFQNDVESLCWDDPHCACELSPYWAQEDGFDCSSYQIMYWYHPDNLGNTEFITDLAGEPYQYHWYNAFGEGIVDQYAQGFYNSPYRFNAKELDFETGNYYYGARYYDPRTSIWLSVDQRAHWYPQTSPYAYVLNNPVNLIDPTGMSATGPDGGGETGDESALGEWNADCQCFDGDELEDVPVTAERTSWLNETWNKLKHWVASVWNKVSTWWEQIIDEADNTQENGNPITGDSPEQLLKAPDAKHKGDPLEVFPMGGGPAKYSDGWQYAFDIVRRAMQHIEKERNEITLYPVPDKPEEKNDLNPGPKSSQSDTTFEINVRDKNGWFSIKDTNMSKKEAREFLKDGESGVMPNVYR